MVREGNTWVGVNTSLTNKLVAEALEKGTIKELQDFDSLKREIKTSDKSRLDLLLTKGTDKIFIEVKNCSLVEGDLAMFPDAVTKRGTKHLKELARLVRQGNRGVIFFCVQREDGKYFKAADHIDPLYAKTLTEVVQIGVEVLAYQARVNPEEVIITKPLPCIIE